MMRRKHFGNRKQRCLSVSARNDADAITVLQYRAWRRQQGVSVQSGLLMVVEGWLQGINQESGHHAPN